MKQDLYLSVSVCRHMDHRRYSSFAVGMFRRVYYCAGGAIMPKNYVDALKNARNACLPYYRPVRDTYDSFYIKLFPSYKIRMERRNDWIR